jgi:indole-3-glycerol phosphate synthase
VTGPRRLSQAISEGDGISILVEVHDAAAARTAEQQGAEGLVVVAPTAGVRDATLLPVVWNGPLDGWSTEADAVVVDAAREGDHLVAAVDQVHALGVECVLRVCDEDDLEHVLEIVDPEILLLSAEEADEDQHHLDRLLELLPDVPAGKLAIAELVVASRYEIAELERAGVDAVLVTAGDIGPLVGDAPPEV